MQLRCSRPVLVAAVLGLFILGGAPHAFAGPIESQEKSVQSAVDRFVAYLKSETNDAMVAAARAVRKHKDMLGGAKASIGAFVADLRGALSEQKHTLATLGKDAAATFEALRQAAASSWAKLQRDAADTLDGIAAWLRQTFPPRERSTIPV